MSQPFREIDMAANFAVSGTLTSAIDVGWADKGFVEMPDAWTAANLGFQVCNTKGGTFQILRTGSDANPVQITNITTGAIHSHAIPAAVFSARYVKLWSKNGTA